MIFYPLSLSKCLIQIKWYLKIEPKIINTPKEFKERLFTVITRPLSMYLVGLKQKCWCVHVCKQLGLRLLARVINL